MPGLTSDADATSSPARAELRREGDALIAVLAGDWDIEQQVPSFREIADEAAPPQGTRTRSASTARDATVDTTRDGRITFDTAELGTWDSSLLVFLQQASAYADKHGLELDADALPERVHRLLSLAAAVPERATPDKPAPLGRVERLGTFALGVWDAVQSTIEFMGEVMHGTWRVMRGRVRMRWREFWVVVQTNSSGALPIVTLIALLVGLIIAFLGVVVLKRFGAGYYVSYLVGFGMLREMGALMTGIIMAGRTGAAFAAEIGSMKITEEVDAYVTLGISPIEHLVLPRMLGLFVMMPLLTIYADFIGIVGGLLVSLAMLDLSAQQFFNGMLYAVTLTDANLGVIKGTIFGFIIGLAGCLKGLQTGSDAGAVGRSATSAVVLAITLIIAANAAIDWLAAILDI
jgi:phospholipid/cholesterol/gamma-HCH transport system permease protein